MRGHPPPSPPLPLRVPEVGVICGGGDGGGGGGGGGSPPAAAPEAATEAAAAPRPNRTRTAYGRPIGVVPMGRG